MTPKSKKPATKEVAKKSNIKKVTKEKIAKKPKTKETPKTKTTTIKAKSPTIKVVPTSQAAAPTKVTAAPVSKTPSSKATTGTSSNKHGYVYIGHLPHGFYEEEVRGYFSQFGKVLKVRMSRSKKTGTHRGYGFVEFQDEDVARIAAETMNNYLMFNKVLKCHVIPRDQVHKEMFRNANKTFTLPKKSDYRKKFNAKKSETQLKVNKKST